MGNQHTVSSDPHTKDNNNDKKNFPKLRPIKSTHKKPKCNDYFFIKHIKNHKNEIDIQSLDQRRHVYISLTSLYQTWKRIPHVSLYSALFILPLKKTWILNPSKQTAQLPSNPLSNQSLFSDDTETNEFIQLLKWKQKQGLVMFMLDYLDSYDNDNLINSFWYELNDTLCSLWDPISNNNYKPIVLDKQWWQNKKTFVSKYDTKTSNILSELYFLTMKFSTISEIIYQSNPDSLYPIKSYPVYCINVVEKEHINCDIDDTEKDSDNDEHDENDKNDGNWFVCEYDPYDIDQCDDINYDFDD